MKRIVILDAVPNSAQAYRYVLWAAVPAARHEFYARADLRSAWKDIAPAELDALRNGSFVEKVETFSTPIALSLAQIRAALEARWSQYQTHITAFNPWDRYGSFFDDNSTWTADGAS